MQPTADRWYTRRYRQERHAPDRFPDWRITNLYYHRPCGFISIELEDLDAWKLVLPREQRAQAIAESHEQVGHLGVDKTY